MKKRKWYLCVID